jgi:hypothetical protein
VVTSSRRWHLLKKDSLDCKDTEGAALPHATSTKPNAFMKKINRKEKMWEQIDLLKAQGPHVRR